MNQSTSGGVNPEQLPFVAPCKQLQLNAPLRWLKLGWQDIRRAPKQSLTYGVIALLLCYVISLMVWYFGELGLYMSLMSVFIFLGPVLAIGLYSISCQIQMGQEPQLGYCLREGRRHLGNEMIFAVILLIVFLVWARAASMVHVFYPVEGERTLSDYLVFFEIGTVIGAIFSAIIFCASAFSLPMIMDRKTDVITAVITSVNAVLRNRKVMLLWGSLIVLAVLIGFATLFIGMVVLLPLIGHATWHAYKETIDASAWPKHETIRD